MKKVIIIPAKSNKMKENKQLNVAAYCRVSTNKDTQHQSLEAQINYYHHLINNKSDWKLVDVYYDKGMSGLSYKNRFGFNLMIESAMNGNIDLIITKSISRFSRNIVDFLEVIRMLKEKKICIYFEKENISTNDEITELMLTIHEAIAQKESISISQNTKWGIRQKMERGEYKMTIAYGYKYNEYDELVINPKEAEIVRLIYELYINGGSVKQIIKELKARDIKSPFGCSTWPDNSIYRILTNEKYTGSPKVQKTYIEDVLTQKRKVNIGQLDKYTYQNYTPQIIKKETFGEVQVIKKQRKQLEYNTIDGTISKVHGQYSAMYLLSNILVCKECGSSFRRRTERNKVVYRCGKRMSHGKEACPDSITVEENEVFEAIKSIFNLDSINDDFIKENIASILINSYSAEMIIKKKSKYIHKDREIIYFKNHKS